MESRAQVATLFIIFVNLIIYNVHFADAKCIRHRPKAMLNSKKAFTNAFLFPSPPIGASGKMNVQLVKFETRKERKERVRQMGSELSSFRHRFLELGELVVRAPAISSVAKDTRLLEDALVLRQEAQSLCEKYDNPSSRAELNVSQLRRAFPMVASILASGVSIVLSVYFFYKDNFTAGVSFLAGSAILGKLAKFASSPLLRFSKANEALIIASRAKDASLDDILDKASQFFFLKYSEAEKISNAAADFLGFGWGNTRKGKG